jgi:hypothetical protein
MLAGSGSCAGQISAGPRARANGGLRIIYYLLINDRQFWMFSVYAKDELENLTADQERQLRGAIQAELKKRGM